MFHHLKQNEYNFKNILDVCVLPNHGKRVDFNMDRYVRFFLIIERTSVYCEQNYCKVKFLWLQELLEKRIKLLEAQLEEERRRTQRERMAVTKLQNKLIKVINLNNIKFKSYFSSQLCLEL